MADTIVRRNDPNAVTPFWNRIPQFFLFPFSAQPLLFMLGVTAVMLVCGLVPVLSIPVVFLGVVAFLRFCYRVFDRAAFGQASTLGIDAKDVAPYRPWKQLAVFLVYGLVVGLVQLVLGAIAGHVVEYAFLLLLPANVMWLGLTNSLLASLNLGRLVELVRAIGRPYLSLCVFLMLLSGAADTATYFLMLGLGETLFALPALALVQMYFTLIAFNMLGYALYQYRDRLGLRGVQAEAAPAVFSLELEVRRAEATPSTLDGRIKQLLDAGRVRQATDLMHELVRLNPGNRRYNERYRAVLQATGNREALLRHAAQYVGVLLQAGEPGPALELYRESRREDASFHLREPEAQLALAQAAADAHEDALAVEAIQDFDLAFPLSPERATAYMMGARLLHMRYGDASEARRLIEEMLRRFPDLPLAPEAKAYLAKLA